MTEQTESKVRNEAKLMCKKWGISNNETKEGYMVGYVQGAFQYRDLIWHDASEFPVPMQECLVYLNDPMRTGYYIGRIEAQGANKGKWNIYGYFTSALHESIIRWAYIEDLLPNKED